MRRRAASLLVVMALVGCGSGRRGGGRPPSGNTPDLAVGDTDALPPTDDCPAEAKLVYVVDQNNTFSSFDPQTQVFKDLGRLDCPAQSTATPFSMTVDRAGTAWVLYSSGELFRVPTATLTCTKTSWTSQLGLDTFGMGFATNAANTSDEKLYIVGGSFDPITGAMSPTSTLAWLDTNTFVATRIGDVTGWPELTGTGDAKLWAFFPDTVLPRVSQLDRSDGSESTAFKTSQLSGQPTAWAFAAWGGNFWIFLQRAGEPDTTVFKLDGMTGAITAPRTNTSRIIVGAGVSTCAPVTIQ